MTVETLILAVVLALGLHFWRHAVYAARKSWSALRWWERILLVICVLPWIGPVDEIVGGWLIARGSRRAARRRLA